MTRKEKIEALRQIQTAAFSLYQTAFSLREALDKNYNMLLDDNARSFSNAATINIKLLAALIEPSGFVINHEDHHEIGQKEFLDIAAVEATMAGKNWE